MLESVCYLPLFGHRLLWLEEPASEAYAKHQHGQEEKRASMSIHFSCWLGVGPSMHAAAWHGHVLMPLLSCLPPAAGGHCVCTQLFFGMGLPKQGGVWLVWLGVGMGIV